MAGTITPKNWGEFQHYKDRKPSWIKLHRDLLDNYDFHCLPLASKALAPCLWLLASEYEGGAIPADWTLIAFRLRMSADEVRDAVTPLIDKGFFVASDTLEDSKQSACLEREKETEREKKEIPAADAPAPLTVAKPTKTQAVTLKTWLDALPDDAPVISPTDPVFEWARKTGVPENFMALSWEAFVERYIGKPKKYKDWRAVWRTAVQDNWLKLWYIDRDGGYALTTVGIQAQRVAA